MPGIAIGDLTLLLLIPVIGAAVLLLVPRRLTGALFFLALAASGVGFAWSLKILAAFDGAKGEMQLIERIAWMPGFGIEYLVGIDGISLFLVLLTTFLMPLAMLASWPVQDKVKEYLVFMLLLETGMLGAFVALDLVLFYVFWEVMLVPMYFLIGVWGGARRIYAAVKFVIFTMAGSLLMLVAIIYLATRYAQETQAVTFDLLRLYDFRLSANEQMWLFLAFALSFSIKVPLFPLHTWLPDAHVEAPTAASVILAGNFAQVRHLRFSPLCAAAFPRRRAGERSLLRRAFRHRYHLRRGGGDDASGYQETGRLFLRQPSRLRDAGAFCIEYAGRARRHLSNAQPRSFHRCAVSSRRHDL